MTSRSANSNVTDALIESFATTRRLLRAIKSRVPSENELVHRLRVATRRTEAAFEFAQSQCPDKDMRRWKKRLKLIRRAAGHARDLDVLLDAMRGDSASDDATIKYLQVQRQEAQAPLYRLKRRWRKSSKWERQYRVFLRRIQKSQKQKSSSPGKRQPPTEILEQRIIAFDKSSLASTQDIVSLHVFRKQVKRLRYALEWSRRQLPKKQLKVLLTELTTIQDHLGQINDHRVALEILRSSPDSKSKKNQKRIVAEKHNLKSCRIAWQRYWTRKRHNAFLKRLKSLTA